MTLVPDSAIDCDGAQPFSQPHAVVIRRDDTTCSRRCRCSGQGWWVGARVVSMLLDGIEIPELPPWLLRAVSVEELRALVDRLRLALVAKALPEN